jgi:hypothetical protein
MSKILFIGDSHTSGYSIDQGPMPDIFIPKVWHPNNYAEIYCKKHNIDGVIYATPGVGNDRYPDWIRFCLDMYPDIDKLILQTTYWNRWMLSSNLYSTFEEEIPLDNFTVHQDQYDNIDRFMDNIQQDCNGHYLFHAKTYPGHMDHLILPDVEKPEPFETANYLQMKVFNELETFISKQNYTRNLCLIDRMCKEKNVKVYMWRLNKDVFIPTELDVYGDLDIVLERTPCIEFLKEKGIDHLKHHVGDDQEHYDYSFHKEIAEQFIPHLIGL